MYLKNIKKKAKKAKKKKKECTDWLINQFNFKK